MNSDVSGLLSPLLSRLEGSLSVSPTFVLVLACVVVALGGVLALAFEYHWRSYGINKFEVLKVRVVYFAGFLFLGGGAILSALAYAFIA